MIDECGLTNDDDVRRARATCARATDATDRAHAYEHYLHLIAEACAALQTKNTGATSANLRWTSTTETGRVNAYDVPCGLFGERAMALAAYGGALRRLARDALLAPVVEASTSTAATEAATNLRRAAGCYRHLVDKVLPPLKSSLEVERANEMTGSFAHVMRLVSLGDAQGAACRRAREKWDGASGVQAHWTLAMKLHVGAMAFYRDADAQLNSNGRDWNGVCLDLLAAVVVGRQTHETEAWLARARVAQCEEKFGDAVAASEKALRALEECKQASSELAAWSSYYEELLSRVKSLLGETRRDNECVYFQKVIPSDVELPSVGVVLAQEIPYEASHDTVKHSFLLSS